MPFFDSRSCCRLPNNAEDKFGRRGEARTTFTEDDFEKKRRIDRQIGSVNIVNTSCTEEHLLRL
jgi:hypothetical protein